MVFVTVNKHHCSLMDACLQSFRDETEPRRDGPKSNWRTYVSPQNVTRTWHKHVRSHKNIPEDQTTQKLNSNSGTRRPHILPNPLHDIFASFFFFFFSWPVFLPDTAPFSRARRCYRGTNSLFCRIASDFKVCLACTPGRARAGTEHVSHTETWGRLLKKCHVYLHY